MSHHDYVWIAIGAVAVIVVLGIIMFALVGNDDPAVRPPQQSGTVMPERRRNSDLYRRSLAARDVSPPGRTAMGLPPYHNEGDWH